MRSRHGDSLVGLRDAQIGAFHWQPPAWIPVRCLPDWRAIPSPSAGCAKAVGHRRQREGDYDRRRLAWKPKMSCTTCAASPTCAFRRSLAKAKTNQGRPARVELSLGAGLAAERPPRRSRCRAGKAAGRGRSRSIRCTGTSSSQKSSAEKPRLRRHHRQSAVCWQKHHRGIQSSGVSGLAQSRCMRNRTAMPTWSRIFFRRAFSLLRDGGTRV